MESPNPVTPGTTGEGGRLPLTIRVSRDLQARINHGELRPGDRLPTERELMARYGVSRTVVREAISSLRASGQIETQQGRGAFVLAPVPVPQRLDAADIGPLEDVLKLVEIRIALESEAAALAAQHRSPAQLTELDAISHAFAQTLEEPDDSATHDQDFHLCVARMSGNSYFADLLSGLSPSLLPRTRVDLYRGDQRAKADYLRRLLMEHAQIRDAIARSNADEARAAMRLHLSHSRERLRLALETARQGG
ncbi:FadR family transcriptional regulator [Roseomonas sp. SSH11]|uniref:FadR family transcriptional regulator n=1 Tax=Pararoseomonas baculiformis TaxID=2820812 RepID=A0ABS4AE78_9PROT|nr:FadR/GntR family transcriptional regulator [Pararoseomonas baculiformis]MBP0445322.1 FadR family transcriptional regulator [Pararoseomonas baculiformis]